MEYYALFTIVKFEHSYINQFIEHHLNIGFNFFYILVDNLNEEQIDYNNIIDNKFKKYLKLYIMTKHFDIDKYNKILDNTFSHHDYFILYFNEIILKDIKEDWIFVVGCDSFLYLNGNKIIDFIINFDINTKEIFQILFPMFLLFNINNNSYTDMCHTFKNYYTINSYYMYSMAKINNIDKLDCSSHYFISKTEQQNIYFPDNKIINIKNSEIKINTLLLNSKFDIFDKNHTNYFSFHFYLRCYDELIIKDLLYWNIINDCKKNQFKIFLKDVIKNNTINKNILTNLNFGGSRIHHFLNVDKYKLCNIEENFNIDNFQFLNNKKYNDDLINNILCELDINRNEYDKLINLIKNYIKETIYE